MKKKILRYTTVLLAFVAGMMFMEYMTRMGNRDMTEMMAEATLPVAYVEQPGGRLVNEMHGYVEAMDGSYMKDTLIGLSEDHELSIALEKYSAQIEGASYEVRSLDMERLIEEENDLAARDDGKYLRYDMELKDLLEQGERYLFVFKVETEEQGEVCYYSQICYLGKNYVQECVDFALEFHQMTVDKDRNHMYLQYLEPNSTMDGKSLGYVNIHSRSGPITWGDMPVRQITDTKLRYTELEKDIASVVLEYKVENPVTGEQYEVTEAIRARYTSSRMYLLSYERTAGRILQVEDRLAEDGKIFFGIQSEEPQFMKNESETVLAFVQQGQLWSYDFSLNRLSKVYGFVSEEDARGDYTGHDFRLIEVEDSGSMEFLVYGYMGRGRYEGRSGVLFCRYDALLNTVEEQFFLPSDRPYEALKEDIGRLAVANDRGDAWISYRGMIIQINLMDCAIQILAENVPDERMQVSKSGQLAAWTNTDGSRISLLNTRNGKVNEISSGEGELLYTLGFMEEDFIYGAVYQENIRTDAAGQQVLPMHRVIIRDHAGNRVREFDYGAKGKYVTDISIVENRMDLSCVTLQEDGSYTEVLPEPITYTSEPVEEQLRLQIVSDEVKRNEYQFVYAGKIKDGSMKRPKVKLVLFEEDRTILSKNEGTELYLAYSFDGKAKGFEALSDAICYAYDQMGSVWKGEQCYWERGGRKTRVQLSGFDLAEEGQTERNSVVQCLQLLLKQKQIYTDVRASLDAGLEIWEICNQEFGEKSCLLPGCNLSMALYYVSQGAPVLAITESGEAVLITGYDTLNVIIYDPLEGSAKKAGMKDSAAMFERAGNLFFTYLP